MIKRLYVHNFRCLENFELDTKKMPSILFIGKNGSGKSTIAYSLEIFQKIGRGTNRVRELVLQRDFSHGRSEVPIQFELEILLNNITYTYAISFELPENFKELRVKKEQLKVDGALVYKRDGAFVSLASKNASDIQFTVDWHLVALPVIQGQSEKDDLFIFKQWLSRMIILSPVPQLMTGESGDETLDPKVDASNFGEWLSGILGSYPAAYGGITEFLRKFMPDIQDFINKPTGNETKNLFVRFKGYDKTLSVDFKQLSDGEKCFFLGAIVMAANETYGPLFCFWDEPDSYCAISEVETFLTSFRRGFQGNSQFFAISHNKEAIIRFSNENTFYVSRKNHIDHTKIRLLENIGLKGDLIENLILDDIEP